MLYRASGPATCHTIPFFDHGESAYRPLLVVTSLLAGAHPVGYLSSARALRPCFPSIRGRFSPGISALRGRSCRGPPSRIYSRFDAPRDPRTRHHFGQTTSRPSPSPHPPVSGRLDPSRLQRTTTGTTTYTRGPHGTSGGSANRAANRDSPPGRHCSHHRRCPTQRVIVGSTHFAPYRFVCGTTGLCTKSTWRVTTPSFTTYKARLVELFGSLSSSEDSAPPSASPQRSQRRRECPPTPGRSIRFLSDSAPADQGLDHPARPLHSGRTADAPRADLPWRLILIDLGDPTVRHPRRDLRRFFTESGTQTSSTTGVPAERTPKP